MIQFKIKPQRKCRDLIYVLSPRSFVRVKKALERKNTPGGLFPPFNLGEIILQGDFSVTAIISHSKFQNHIWILNPNILYQGFKFIQFYCNFNTYSNDCR